MVEGFVEFNAKTSLTPELGHYCIIELKSGMMTYAWYCGWGFALEPHGREKMVQPGEVMRWRSPVCCKSNFKMEIQ